MAATSRRACARCMHSSSTGFAASPTRAVMLGHACSHNRRTMRGSCSTTRRGRWGRKASTITRPTRP
jgi:hypothetical protein